MSNAPRWPAEWEAHEATWLAWPHNVSDWAGKFATIPWAYAEIARALAPGEIVRIIVQDKALENRARRALEKTGVDPARVEFFRWPTDRSWTRDYGPLFVEQEPASKNQACRAGKRPALKKKGIKSGQNARATNREPGAILSIARFRFNAWAKYRHWRQDDRIPFRAARALSVPLLPVRHRGRDVVLEGGAIESNGRGTLLATEECLLDPRVQVRNPGFTRRDYEAVFRRALGAERVLWLGRGIAGDDTHGHVDDLCRFVNPHTVVLCREKDPREVNYRALEENRERLQGARTQDGKKIESVELPMPRPLFFEGWRLPASYANFYIGNAAVLVPAFNDPADRFALGILGELFPERPVVGIHALDLVWGLGALHCLTQPQPARR